MKRMILSKPKPEKNMQNFVFPYNIFEDCKSNDLKKSLLSALQKTTVSANKRLDRYNNWRDL